MQCICKDITFGLLDTCVCQCSALAEQPPAFGPLPIVVVSSQAPTLLELRPSILMELSLPAAHRRAPAGITEPKQLFAIGTGSTCCNEITAYLFLLFSVYLLCFPVHTLFFASFLKELLFNSIAGINYCIASLQSSIRAMTECNTNTKTHAQTLPELNPCNVALSNGRGNINRRDHQSKPGHGAECRQITSSNLQN